jgi:hypothetical protein
MEQAEAWGELLAGFDSLMKLQYLNASMNKLFGGLAEL